MRGVQLAELVVKLEQCIQLVFPLHTLVALAVEENLLLVRQHELLTALSPVEAVVELITPFHDLGLVLLPQLAP